MMFIINFIKKLMQSDKEKYQEKYLKLAEELKKAFEGWGNDTNALIKITSDYTNAERQKIREAYKYLYTKELIDDFIDELSGNLEDVVVGMWRTPTEYDVMEIYKAVKGLGTNEDSLNEILGSRSNFRLNKIKLLYKELYKQDLEERIKSEVSGDYQTLLLGLLQCKRDETNRINKSLIEQDVLDLYKAGEGKLGTDEEFFTRVFALRSATHLTQINLLYKSTYGSNLLDIVKSEFSGCLGNLLQTILHAKINPADYYADRIYQACKGWGTNNSLLIRSLITIDEEFLTKVKAIYPEKYKMSLEDQIKDETSGYFSQMLLDLIKK